MVKIILSLSLLFSLVMSDDIITHEEDNLSTKIASFVGADVYAENVDFINVIFDPKSEFYTNDRVDVIKVIKTLEDNGLLKLFFKEPKKISLNFKTSGSPLFFVKLMGDSLRNIGYYRYVTTASSLDSSEFIWNINLTSEYATDPIVLQNELNKRGCIITNIERNSATDWTYVIDIGNAYLNMPKLKASVKVKLKHSLYAHWVNCSGIKKIKIKSSIRNHWFPYIAYYDSSLHLIKVIKEDKKSREIVLYIPKRAKYMKISDLYTLKNVRDELIIYSYGQR